MSNLISKHCIPCDALTKPFDLEQAQSYLPDVPDWELDDEAKKIKRKFKFKNFAESLAFVNKVGELAESEGHHPDIELGWGYVKIKLTTHAIHGLSENDFILAAKINEIFK